MCSPEHEQLPRPIGPTQLQIALRGSTTICASAPAKPRRARDLRQLQLPSWSGRRRSRGASAALASQLRSVRRAPQSRLRWDEDGGIGCSTRVALSDTAPVLGTSSTSPPRTSAGDVASMRAAQSRQRVPNVAGQLPPDRHACRGRQAVAGRGAARVRHRSAGQVLADVACVRGDVAGSTCHDALHTVVE